MAGSKISLSESYKILQIPQNSDMKEVKHAYRKWAFELHPDLHPDKPSANLEFQQLNEAYVNIIAHLDAKEKKVSAKVSFFDSKSNTVKVAKEAAKQKAQEEELKRKERQTKKEQERKERQEWEKQANERLRAKERTDREKAERVRLREQMEKEDAKRKIKKEAEQQNAFNEEVEKDATHKTRLFKQMDDEARKNKKSATNQDHEAKTRAYSSFGKAIPDQKKYHGSAKGPDTYNASEPQNEQAASRVKFSTDEDMREKILEELLEDDYARKVYEDIYNELHARKNEPSDFTEPQGDAKVKKDTASNATNNTTKAKFIKAESVGPKTKGASPFQGVTEQITSGVKQGISGWFKGQIDDELELFFPASKLIAGARMRLQIRTGWSGELQTVELTLPTDFVPGKAFRLRGLGKKIGKWQGDLYLKLKVR